MKYKYQANISNFNHDSFCLESALLVSRIYGNGFQNCLFEAMLKDKTPLNFKKEYSYSRKITDMTYTEFKTVSWLVKRRTSRK